MQETSQIRCLMYCKSSICKSGQFELDSVINWKPVAGEVMVRNEVPLVSLGRVHPTALGPERFRNATGRPCSHLFHCVRSFRNEPTTSRSHRSGTVPERVRLALWCERATGPVPEPFQLPVTFVYSQAILHISKRSSLHGILPHIV